MAEIVVIGGGVAGLGTGMLLAADGHSVRLLERDAQPPPTDPEQAWGAWERRGVNQFRMVHFFLARFRQILDTELPAVARALDDAGALRVNPVLSAPAEITGGPQDGDEMYEAITGRRPVVESALGRVAEGRAGLTIVRGAAVAELRTGTPATDGVPHVVGVRLEDGRELSADLVVDASGRRSPLPRWLEAIGARPVAEEVDDSGFVYYGRHFRSADGSLPPVMAPLLSHYGSVSVLTLPADNGTWGVAFIGVGGDAALRGLKDVATWEATLQAFPLVAHWADGQPLADDVAVMAKIEDRIRSTVVDGVPVATGVVTVGDAWACTNPSVGRGASMGLMHAVALRDHLRTAGSPSDDPAGFAATWAETTSTVVEPWYRATLHYDRNRLAEAQAAIDGVAYEPDDQTWQFIRAMEAASFADPEVFRAYLGATQILFRIEELYARPGFADKVMALGGGWREQPVFGPTRDELVKIVNA